MGFSGWFVVNVAAPMLLPVLGILPMLLLPLPPPTRLATLHLMATVKDGQLCWAVIGMSAATIYDIWQAVEEGRKLPPAGGFALALAVLILLPATIVAAGGAVFNTALLAAPAGSLKSWLAHYKLFMASLLMAMAMSADYVAVHSALSP